MLFAACGSADPSASPSTSPSAVTAAPSASPSPVASPSQVASPTASAGTPTASGEAATNAIYDAVETQVQALRGLTAVRPVPRQLITADELRTMLTKEFDDETPPAYLAAQERLYKALGLIKPDASLRTLTLDLLSGGVAAFYRDDQGRIYVRSKQRRARRRPSASTSRTSTTTRSRTSISACSRTRRGSSTRAIGSLPGRPCMKATRR